MGDDLPAITGRSVFSFDAARGPRWWMAPLVASIAASFVFSANYFPAVFAGVYEQWMDSAIAHLVEFCVTSVLLLGSYWLLRPAMRPINGMNRY